MADVGGTLAALREQAPLVHSITNLVGMDLSANVLLAAGASPLMAHAPEEVDEVVAAADALVVNIGTLTSEAVDVMAQAAVKAGELGMPWVLDPVGVGATVFRNDAASRLAELEPAVIRANASEVLALAGVAAGRAVRGVDTSVDSLEALDAAGELAARCGTTVAVTGSIDYVTDGRRLFAVANGVPMMARVTAMGCALSGLVAACLAVCADATEATTHALAIYGVAGECAAVDAEGPGSLRWRLLDALDSMDKDTLQRMASIDG
ncbi:hydroxyethylthiazole kinase [Ferruginivarius sediminum]|uniref:Hydroxyethylthiazole kinase n=1 Tax=Ferruginivarius sediminum TaxID=2661937 RepID=A0A369TEB0_9PROT|nr:hydroxyethylthiazole kinase [Ferruginivarius sediminum]RDD63669.1 hydroxyethylthiazole kinase [Ferruginivarius sediminum]